MVVYGLHGFHLSTSIPPTDAVIGVILQHWSELLRSPQLSGNPSTRRASVSTYQQQLQPWGCLLGFHLMSVTTNTIPCVMCPCK